MTRWIGIDPGCKGGIAVLGETGLTCDLLKLEKSTEMDVVEFLEPYRGKAFAVLEKLSPAPPFKSKQAKPDGDDGFGRGGIANFKIGDSFGVLRGILTACRITYAIKTPQVWQRSMGCLTKGEKKVTKAAAQRLFPSVRCTDWNADALLIASYCKIHSPALFPQAAQPLAQENAG